jgi:hypothetical protein
MGWVVGQSVRVNIGDAGDGRMSMWVRSWAAG